MGVAWLNMRRIAFVSFQAAIIYIYIYIYIYIHIYIYI